MNTKPHLPDPNKDTGHRWRPKLDLPQAVREIAGGSALIGYAAVALAGLWSISVVSLASAAAAFVLALFLGLIFVRVAHAQAPRRALTLWLAGTALIAGILAISAIAAFAFTPVAIPGWIVTALYVAALAAGAWKELKRFERIFAAIFGLALAAVATSLIVVPGAGEAAESERPGFQVMVAARDMHGRPVAGALANCTLFDAWGTAPLTDPTLDPKITNDEGQAGPWEFPFGHPFKAVLCSAAPRAAGDGGESKISTRGLYFPLPGASYTVNLAVNPPFDPNAP